MFNQKYSLLTICLLSIMSLFLACAQNENEVETSESKQEEEKEIVEIEKCPNCLSEAFENYNLWFYIKSDEQEINENSSLYSLFIFHNGYVNEYRTLEGLTVEDLLRMTDEEIVNYAKTIDEDYYETEPYVYTLDIDLNDEGDKTDHIHVEMVIMRMFSVVNESIQETFNQTHLSGLLVKPENEDNQSHFIVTKVADPSISFTLDQPDSENEHVTVEYQEEILREREEFKSHFIDDEWKLFRNENK